MKLNIDCLLFEVTRKCNMTCLHCLRGNAQEIDMTKKIVNRTLKDVNYVSHLTFTGGEPTLNVPIIKYIFGQFHKRNIELFDFWLATNGKIYSQSLMNTLFNEYVNCIDRNDEFYGGIAVSYNDGYHDKIIEKNVIKYQCVKFYDGSKSGRKKDSELISDGNARINGIGQRKIPINKELDFEFNNDELRILSNVYINAKGDVLTECDYSYARQKQAKIGNVLEKPLLQIIQDQIKKQDPETNFFLEGDKCAV